MKDRQVLRCDRCDYISGIIGHPYGLPVELAEKAAEMHQQAFSGHTVSVTLIDEC